MSRQARVRIGDNNQILVTTRMRRRLSLFARRIVNVNLIRGNHKISDFKFQIGDLLRARDACLSRAYLYIL